VADPTFTAEATDDSRVAVTVRRVHYHDFAIRLGLAEARALAAQLAEAIAAATHRPSPRPGHYRFSSPDGDPVRVVIAGDVIALPEEGWSLGGFGRHISEEWLLTQARPKIPGTARRRLVLATCIRAALEEHYAPKGGKEEG
jgi:hypothetical protein